MQASAPLEIAADGHVVNFRDDSRHTRIGRILRRYSLDEIPQLFNILRGQMSLVGPRPDLPEALTFYSPVARTRLEVRPGMTGLAQLHGRNTLSPSQKWSWDAEYVRRASLRLDLKILAATISRTLQGDGLYRDAT